MFSGDNTQVYTCVCDMFSPSTKHTQVWVLKHEEPKGFTSTEENTAHFPNLDITMWLSDQ